MSQNIKTDSGEICADVLGNWAPTLNVRHILGTIKHLLEEPNTESPLEPTIAAQYTGDRAAFNTSAKAYTVKHAGGS